LLPKTPKPHGINLMEKYSVEIGLSSHAAQPRTQNSQDPSRSFSTDRESHLKKGIH